MHFAQHGAAGLALADIRPASVAAVAALLGETHAHVRVVPLVLDVTSADGVRAAVAQAVAALGRLDVAVNNAGVAGTTSRTHELPDEAWDRTLAVDLNGVFYCQREELAVMMQQECVFLPRFLLHRAKKKKKKQSSRPPTWSRRHHQHGFAVRPARAGGAAVPVCVYRRQARCVAPE